MLHIARKPTRETLITRGASCLGAHLAATLLATSDACITLLDDLADPGAAHNLSWLLGQAGEGRLKLVRGDVRNAARALEAARGAAEIYYLAHDAHTGQETDTKGVSNLLEAARRSGLNPVVICASIGNHQPAEQWPAPLCCSSADLLVRDFAQLHRLPAVVLRVDTVTGPRQFGAGEDWVARAEYAILGERSCCLPGDPSQMHNVLHVSDAVQAMLAARAYIGKTAGKVYGVSGGGACWVTEEQMVHLIEHICHRKARIEGEPMGLPKGRQAIANDVSFLIDTAWRARRSLEETVRDIAAFWHANQQIISTSQRQQRVPARLSRVRAA